MFHRIHDRAGSASFILAIIVLIAVLAGGAIAATGGSHGRKATASSTGKRGPRGKEGKPGPIGPAGPQGPSGLTGPKGDAGAKGDSGVKGDAGTNGKGAVVTEIPTGEFECNELGGAKVEVEDSGSGVDVCNGEQGKDGTAGKEGSPWTAGGTLPSGATETGGWAFNGTAANTEGVYAAISFPIPLAAPLAGSAKVHYGSPSEEPFHSICTGSVSKPTAPSGDLCVYKSAEGFQNTTFGGIWDLQNSNEDEASTGGALLYFTMSGVGYGTGSWAVTG